MGPRYAERASYGLSYGRHLRHASVMLNSAEVSAGLGHADQASAMSAGTDEGHGTTGVDTKAAGMGAPIHASAEADVLSKGHYRTALRPFPWTRRRLIILGALLVAAIFSVSGLMIAAQHDATLVETERDTAALALVLAEQTSRTMQPVDLTLREIMGRLTEGRTNGQDNASWGSKATFDLLVERLRALPQVGALLIIGQDGRSVNDSGGFPAPSQNTSDRDFYQYLSTHDDHSLFVSAPLRAYSNGKWTVFFCRRVNDRDGGFAGIVGAGVTLSYLEDFYQAVTPQGSAVTVLRRDGLILGRYPATEQKVGVRLPPEAPWYKVAEGGGSYRSPGYVDSMASVVSVRPLREFPLVIDVSTSRTAALANWRADALLLLAGTLFVAACVIFLLRVFGLQYGQLARQNGDLETSQVRFDAVLDNMSQGLTLFDRNAKLLVCNRRYLEIYNLSANQCRPGTSLSEIVRYRTTAGSFPDMTEVNYLARRKDIAESGQPFELTDHFCDGREISMHYRPLPDGGWVVTHEDITERRRAAASLVFMARHDPLTGLPNRTLFQERLTQAVAMTGRGTHCALLCLDLDRFKIVNDTLGHPVGDALLRAVAARIAAQVRTVDTVARLGGDEFAIILVNLKSPGHAAGLANRILAALHQPHDLDGHRIISGASIGISIAPKDGTSSDTLLKHADLALYLAKTEGRGTYRFFEPEIDAQIQHQRCVEMELRNALPEKDFELHYQPILDLGSGALTGFEALIRWNHPVRGLVSPAEFIPIAEETGLILPIGAWALRQACQEAAGWPPQIAVAVNLSPAQFRDSRLFDAVQEALHVSGLQPGRLELEITETVFLENSANRLALLHRLRALGIRIALDDFGTGYSSLSYLRSFPFDTIKIDRSFIREVDTNKESLAIVKAIVGLGRALGMTTLAEGVETSQQLTTVRDQGCSKVQGYLFSRPRPANEVPALIRELCVPDHARPGSDAETTGSPPDVGERRPSSAKVVLRAARPTRSSAAF